METHSFSHISETYSDIDTGNQTQIFFTCHYILPFHKEGVALECKWLSSGERNEQRLAAPQVMWFCCSGLRKCSTVSQQPLSTPPTVQKNYNTKMRDYIKL